MQKKILAVSLAVLLVAFGAVACGKKDKIEEDSTYAPVEYTTDAETGEVYITNVYGDLIPVTTSKDGGMELMEDLVTKTKEQVEKEKESISAEENNTKEPTGTQEGNPPASDDSGENKPTGGNSGGGLVVGTDSIADNEERDAVIIW